MVYEIHTKEPEPRVIFMGFFIIWTGLEAALNVIHIY